MRLPVDEMKKLLACLVAAITFLSTSGASEPSTDVSPVLGVVASEAGIVTWTPPPLSPEDLQQATYRIWGKLGDVESQLDTADSLSTHAFVASGYESYGVQVVLGVHVSVIVYSCIFIEQDPPDVKVECP